MYNMSLLEETIIKTGQKAPVSGYYIYKTNPASGEIPCYPQEGERVIVLEQGQEAPNITSCNHPAVWQLVTVKKSTTTLQHTH